MLGFNEIPVCVSKSLFAYGFSLRTDFITRYYGGWAAPNMYFLGYAGVIKFGDIRIGGLSGIYNERHYKLGSSYAQINRLCIVSEAILTPMKVVLISCTHTRRLIFSS